MTPTPFNVGAFVLGAPTSPRALVRHADLLTAYADAALEDDREAYLSHFAFGAEMQTHYAANRQSVAGFAGPCWCRWLVLDIDRADLTEALADARRLVTALYRRERTGKGGVAQTSLLQNGLWANGCYVQNRLFGEHVKLRPPRVETPSALANHYRCRDGRWFLMALHNEVRQLESFLKAIDASHLVEDPRFATKEARRQNARALTAILDDVFAKRDLAEWRPLLEAAGVTFGAVYSVNEAGDDAQSRAIGALVPFVDGKGFTVSSPFHLDETTKVAPVRAPSVGQHSEQVLREAGYSAQEIARLKQLGILEQPAT